jgi:hypothetical protein
MLLLVFIVPAIQNSIFTTTSKLLTHTSLISIPHGIVDTSAQTHTMTNNFQVTAYAIAWLGQSDPPFTTESYAVAPVDLTAVKHPSRTSVTTSTTRYWSEVDCWKPVAVSFNATSKWTSFADGRGCQTKDVFSDASHWNSLRSKYLAIHVPVDSPGFGLGTARSHSQEANTTSMCPEFPNRFLSIWWVGGSDPDFKDSNKGVALFCDINYYKEPVVAKIMVANSTVASITASGPRKILGPEEFNMTHFMRLTIDGTPPNLYTMSEGHMQMTMSINDRVAVDDRQRRQNRDIGTVTYPTQNSFSMISWVLRLAPAPTGSYFDHVTLARSYTRTYQRLFALAMGHNFAPSLLENQQKAQMEVLQECITLVPAFLYVTETLLVLALITCSILAWQVASIPLELFQNPDCLLQIMDLARSTAIQARFTKYSSSPESIMETELAGNIFRLTTLADGRPGLHVHNPSPTPQSSLSSVDNTTPSHPSKILEISWRAIVSALISIAAVMISLYLLDSASKRNNGMPLPKGNAFTIQLALSFAPTAFATFLGQYLSGTCRVVSFMKPMEELKKGCAHANSTLLVKYSALPPVALFPPAFRAGHYLVGILSILAALSNVLTVTMAGLFVQYTTSLSTGVNVTRTKEPFLDTMKPSDTVLDGLADSVYTVAANQSGLTKLPTWTTAEYAYIPAELGNQSTSLHNPEVEYESVGYGADLDCVNLLTIQPDQSARFEIVNNNSALYFSFCYGYPKDGHIPCNEEVPTYWGMSLLLSQVPDEGIVAHEFQTTVSRPNSPVDTHPSWNSQVNEQQIVFAWLRGQWEMGRSPMKRTANSTSFRGRNLAYNATVIACRPRLRTQKSIIRVDSSGTIVSAKLLGGPDYNVGSSLNLTNSLRTTIMATAYKSTDRTIAWHKGIIAQDWPNYLYKTVLASTDMIDPKKPVPSVDFASGIVSETFSRLFAVQLSLDRQYLRETDIKSQDASQSGSLHYIVRRFRLSRPMYIITQTLLTFDFIVLLICRLTFQKPFLPREPFTIASQIAYAASSHVIDDIAAAVSESGYNRGFRLRNQLLEYRFGYGRYIGKDGRTHIGIERAPFVQSLNSK